MRRIESTRVPSETRRMLRERLLRFLPTYIAPKGGLEVVVRPSVSDKELVEILLNLEFFPGDDIAKVRTKYEKAAQSQAKSLNECATSISIPQSGVGIPTPTVFPVLDIPTTVGTISVRINSESPRFNGLYPPPSFEELVSRGWIRISWGRVSVPRELVINISRQPEAAGTAFKSLVEERHRDVFAMREGFIAIGEIQRIADGIVAGDIRPSEVACISSAWVAARMWDTPIQVLDEVLDTETRLSRWMDKWELLNFPSFSLSRYIEPSSFREFIEVSITVLQKASTTPTWEEFQAACIAPVNLLYPHRSPDFGSGSNLMTETFIERIQWLARGRAEQTSYEFMETRGSNLFGVLLNELQDASFDTQNLTSRIMELVVERPVLLQQLALRVRQAPSLLADMLMAPQTCTMACSLIVSWEFNTGGWNQKFQDRANHTTEMLAFEDAIAMLGGHLDAGLLPSNELAALYLYIYELVSNPSRAVRHYDALSLLRQELMATEPTTQNAVFDALVEFASSGVGNRLAFGAALDFISEGECADLVEPSEIVSLYLEVLLLKGESVGLRQLELKASQTFVSLALRCDVNLKNRFLNAIDVRAWIHDAPASPDELYSYHELLARRIRLHIRLLSQAIAGWPIEVPEVIVDALSRAINAGATDHLSQGRVDAFVPGPGFGLSLAEEQPIALNLSAALRKLHDSHRQRLVSQLCQVNEPLVLAGIIANTPVDIHEQIKAHLRTLTPQNSPEVFNLPALQARVDALLNAELPEIAEVFLAAEKATSTWGPVPGRVISTLRADLRLLLLRQDWAAITAYNLPADLSEALRNEGNEMLLFYRGIAELKKENGNPVFAETMFLELNNRHRGVTAYPINLFACRVTRLLRDNSFGLLSGDALTQAKQYLVEAQQETRPLIQHSPADLKALDANRAMLLLATNQPQQSLHVLMEITEKNFDVNIEGFRALAMARLGRKREAESVLLQAERAFGRLDFLSAIRENIDTDRAFSTVPNMILDDDPVPGIRHALGAFSRLGAPQQAAVLQSRGRLDLYLLDEVRGACASIVAIAPMMRELGMVRYEDDISGVLKQVLRSRLLLSQWSVEDQARGGFSQTGGVGERDIVISKGSATLAVIEALIVDSVAKGNLNSHFTKLLGYDTCRYFFHISYARRSNCAAIILQMRTACERPPTGFIHLRNEELDDDDSMPVGFKAYYEIDSRKVVVFFLALEIGQPIQRDAAAMS